MASIQIIRTSLQAFILVRTELKIMKFAREFRSVLKTEGFPDRWVASAVPYGQLKKCLKKVHTELQSLDLNIAAPKLKSTLDKDIPITWELSIVDQQNQMNNNSRPCTSNLFLIHFQNGVVADAVLSPETTTSFQDLAFESCNQKTTLEKYRITEETTPLQVEMLLIFKVEFFKILKDDVASLDLLQAQEEKALGNQIEALSIAITNLARPSKFRKTDMYRWRELFNIYLQANIFFSSYEVDRGTRDSRMAANRLGWFQNELIRRGLDNLFKIRASKEALGHFLSINISLLQILKFQEINQKAVSKILKKFAKRTKINVGSSFSQLIKSDALEPGSIAKTVCSKVTQDLVQIVPQIDDYLCPICQAILWQPIRMKCRHFFCIQCIITLQESKSQRCPLCRENVVMEADQDNIDGKLVTFLKKYFPKEVKSKQIAHETSIGIERYGIYYKHPSEEKCCIM